MSTQPISPAQESQSVADANNNNNNTTQAVETTPQTTTPTPAEQQQQASASTTPTPDSPVVSGAAFTPVGAQTSGQHAQELAFHKQVADINSTINGLYIQIAALLHNQVQLYKQKTGEPQ